MARRSKAPLRSRSGKHSGVTLVELLVTIVVSGLFFASIVPVFVFAQRTSSGDRARVVALNVAQSKIELIRDVPYDQLTSEFLNGGSAEALALGLSTQWKAEDDDRPFTINYTVAPYPSSASPGMEDYKVVTVDVWWTPPPKPVKHAVLRTAVYQQFAGSEITKMDISPQVEIADPDGGPPMRYLKPTPADPVKVTVDISPIDWPDTDYVVFSVYANNGTQVAGQKVYADRSSQTRQVTWTWTWPADKPPGDGFYTFSAVATTIGGEAGNMWKIVLPLDQGPPAPPTWPSSDGIRRGNNKVLLNWKEPVPIAGDLTMYEVIRRGGTADEVFGGIPTWSTTMYYVDRGVGNLTVYDYSVRARDFGVEPSAESPALTASLPSSEIVADLTAPDAPVQLARSIDGQTVRLTWAPSPSDGVVGYLVYRDGGVVMQDGVARDHVVPIAYVAQGDMDPNGSYAFTDFYVGWGATRTYEVVAIDAALNESDLADATTTAPIGQAPVDQRFTLTVTVEGAGAQITVESLDNYAAYSAKVSGKRQQYRVVYDLDQNESRSFDDLPYGWYRVIAAFYGDETPTIQDFELYKPTEVTMQYSGD